MIRPILNKTPYELFKGRKPNIMHLRVFGCKCHVHNNRKDALGKFDPRSDEAIFLGYSSHSKVYKVFNKTILCVEESVHVLFDETNSLVENDAQDEEYELGLARKDSLLTHEKGKCLEDGSGPGADLLEGGQGLNQTGGSVAETSLKQDQPNSLRTCLKTGSRIGLETGTRTGFEPISSSNLTRMESTSVDPLTARPWKHQISHPLDQILSDINTRVQTRSILKSYCAFYAFLSTIEPKNINEALLIQIGSLPCKRNSISLKGTRCGTSYHGQRIDQSLAPSGCFGTSLINSEQSLGTGPDWWFKATTKKRELIMKKPLHQLQGLRLSVFW